MADGIEALIVEVHAALFEGFDEQFERTLLRVAEGEGEFEVVILESDEVLLVVFLGAPVLVQLDGDGGGEGCDDVLVVEGRQGSEHHVDKIVVVLEHHRS